MISRHRNIRPISDLWGSHISDPALAQNGRRQRPARPPAAWSTDVSRGPPPAADLPAGLLAPLLASQPASLPAAHGRTRPRLPSNRLLSRSPGPHATNASPAFPGHPSMHAPP
ncbi:hypothetical protein PsYK624_056440 [Phanerochaete sordida]|uniref:Uncharacterized protein n=1 Tax=Phanerochaete sordida TaxID=48140 RepID=A0A9P3G5F4_9APHY|nr:hypothetical protein PsYK624_056440 [Phanerochaete sordida]